MLQMIKTRTFRIVGIIAVLIGLYALAGFVIAPRLIRSALLEDIPKTLGVTPTVGEIHINPFLFQVTVDKFSLQGKGGEKLVGFDRLFVDFELSSIWHRAYSFGNIDITAPYVGASIAKDGTLNLLQLQPKAAAQPKPQSKNEPLPAIRIGSFKVSQGLVTYEDRSRPDVFSARLEPVNFELRDFTTGVEGGKFTFTGSSTLGERIEWHGHVSVQPIESDGEFKIDGLRVHTLWEYLEDRLNFTVNSGTIDLAATYKFSTGGPAAPGTAGAAAGPANVQVEVSKVALNDLSVRPKDSDVDWISIPALTVTGTTVDIPKRLAHVDRVSLTGLKVVSWLEADGSVNLLKLAAAPSPPAAAAGAAPGSAPTAAPSPAAAPTLTANSSAPAAANAPWQFDLRQFDLREGSLSAEDRTAHPAVKVLLAPFALQVNGISQDMTRPVSVVLDTHINGKGSLAVSGEVTPQPATANLSLKLADFDLTAIQPYIAQHSSLTLLSGKVGADAKVHYATQKNQPALQLSADINLEKLHTVDDALRDDFINWDRLDILGVNYGQGPDHLDIERIVARKLYARVIIEPDESMNVKRVLAPPGTAAGSAAAPATPPKAAPAAATAARGPAKHGGASKQAHDEVRSASTGAAAPPMQMSVKKIEIHAGQANFADLSVKPNFSTGIQALEGTVVGLSSKPSSRAKVDLHGSVGAYSPVSITGDLNVLGPKLHTDIAMSFRNMELTIFNPYSGKFAGYNISKGKLTTELHYKVDGRSLDAQHHIVVDQLEFGEKTASKDAVSLPVKLAVSLLKDRNGVIDLNLPVTGSLDDPKFKLSGVIWQVLVNLLEKAITAPFALLGSLFGGGPEMQFIDFQPGASTLDAAAVDKVKAVEKALIERPQLKIEVPIAVVPDLDRPALVAAQFKAQVGAAQSVRGGSKKTAAAGPAIAYEQLDPAAQLEVLTRLYVKDFGAEPKYPESVTSLKAKSDIAAAKLVFLDQAVHEHIQVGDAELQALGQQRALALQQVLLSDPQLVAERVFLVANDKATSKDGVVRLELSLQ